MVSHHRRNERQERYQYEPQSPSSMYLRDDEDYRERQSATLTHGYGMPAAQQPTTSSGNPGEHAAADPNEQLIDPMKQSIIDVIKDLDAVMDQLERVRQTALRRQKRANLVLDWVPGEYYVLQEEARAAGKPIPTLLVSPEIERGLRQASSDFELLQGGLKGHEQAAQDVHDQLQRLRAYHPTLSPDCNSVLENELQERLALFGEKRQEIQRLMTSLQSTHQDVKDWNVHFSDTPT